MSDVDKDTGTETIDRKSTRTSLDPAADKTDEDFEGHRRGGRGNATEDPAADDRDSEFEGHMKPGRHGSAR